MRQRTARISSLALAVAATVGAAAFGPSAQAAPAFTAPGHEATRAALRAVVEKGELPGVAAMARDGRGAGTGRPVTPTPRPVASAPRATTSAGPASPRRS